MRSDMAKVLVERPRVQGRYVPGASGKGYKKRTRKALESVDGTSSRESTLHMYNSRGDKRFNEHLGPLRRYLNSHVGRPWAKVYSEICQHVNRGNVVQNHILTHLFEYVVVEVAIENGDVFRAAHERRHDYRNWPLRGPDRWYVCPSSGLLKRAKPESRKAARLRWNPVRLPSKPLICLSKSRFLNRLPDGRWQLVSVEPWPKDDLRNPQRTWKCFDVLFGKGFSHCDRDRLREFYGREVYAVSTRILKKYELKNCPATLPSELESPNVVR